MKIKMPDFNRARVLVVGDVMLDRYWHGSTSRVSPEAPVPVVKVNNREDRPGGAGNVALNITSLGAYASLVGLVGNDEAADSLAASLEASEVDNKLVSVESHPTITKLRVISRHQQLLRMDFEEPFLAADAAGLTAQIAGLLEGMNALVLSDYGKGVLENPQPWIQSARARGLPVLIDPKGTDFSRYCGATLLTPNLDEFERVVGHCSSEEELVKRGIDLIVQCELEALLVTRGEGGMTLLRPGFGEFHLPARAREVFDVTGAGDTVISVLATAIAAGSDFPDAMGLANLAAGLVVGKLGTAASSAPELRRAVQREQGFERGAVSPDQLEIVMADARAHGERVVMTNGCFDIIHAGHVGYLEQARALGDRLVVAVNSDASVRRLKGAGRPVNPLDRRLAVLAGLESVDWVVGFEQDTPEELLRRLRPDILVKGGDYQHDEVVGWEIVEGYGGEVAVLDFLDNVSTTAIVEQIRDS